MKCKHCKDRKAIPGKRDLCIACYFTPAIRRKYPSKIAMPGCEPTMAELDELIAERMQNLPKWWNDCKPERGRKQEPSR